MNSERLAYMAGIVDGEGCITIHSTRGYFGLEIYVVNTYKPLLDWVESLFGGATYLHKVKTSPRWDWQIRGKDAQDLLITLLPYLIVKRNQAELAIAFPILPRSGPGLTEAAKTIKIVQKMFYEKMHSLNSHKR